MSKLTAEQIDAIRQCWDDDLYPNNAQFYALCDTASVRDAEPVAWEVTERDGRPILLYNKPSEDDCAEYSLSLKPLYLHPTAKPSADELKGWAVFGPDGDCDHVVAGESEQFAWESFSQNSNWRTKNVPPEHWKEKGYTCVEVRITRLARSAT